MNKLFIENSIADIIRLYKEGKLLPRQVFVAAIENIKESDSQYFAWVNTADNNLSERVQKEFENFGISEEHLLEYIPIGVKDIYNTRDYPTQMGSKLWQGYRPGNDARVVYNLRRQGAEVVGKTVTAEFAVHALEKTLNPYDATRTPGTSSSGSAVAVSTGTIPFATGSQTAGSVVRPASFCGIYGMKPSFGLIPRTGTLKTTDSLDTLGFFTLHEKDLRIGFESMRVSGKNYPISNAALTDKNRQNKVDGRPWRVGFARTHTWELAPQYAREAMESYLKNLATQKDIEVIDAPLPKQMQEAHTIHQTIYDKALSYYFENEYTKPEQISPVMREIIARGRAISPEQYVAALKAQTELIYEMDDYFKDFDVLISLSTAGEAPLREVVETPDPALMWTLTHQSVVSVPVFTSPGGLPFGMQVTVRKYNDYLLLDFLDYLQGLSLIPKNAGYCVKNS